MNTSEEKEPESRMSIRVDEEIRDEFHAAARVKGTRAATLLHQYMVTFIKTIKKEDPEDFAEKLAIVLSEKELEEEKRREKKRKKAGIAASSPEGEETETVQMKEAKGFLRIDDRTGKPIRDLRIDKDYIPKSEFILIEDEEKE